MCWLLQYFFSPEVGINSFCSSVIVQISPLTLSAGWQGDPVFGVRGGQCVALCIAGRASGVHSSSLSLWAGTVLECGGGWTWQTPRPLWCHIPGSAASQHGFFPGSVLAAIAECCLPHCCDIRSGYEQIEPLSRGTLTLILTLNWSKQSNYNIISIVLCTCCLINLTINLL